MVRGGAIKGQVSYGKVGEKTSIGLLAPSVPTVSTFIAYPAADGNTLFILERPSPASSKPSRFEFTRLA
jgi:hypothetical protein